ncbi:MAG: ABC transporter permease [Brumimicrobium sp.]|nr:ABC transporter permease [Brumimicrobium sp.]
MNKIALIAKREIAERLGSRSFRAFMILGPILVLAALYLFFALTTSTKKDWNVLIMDKNELLKGKLTPSHPKDMTFDFINAFVEYDEFANLSQFKKYDLAVTINEKVISNKHVTILYKEYPPLNVQRKLVYFLERRVEELMVEQFTDLPIEKFREIKQSLAFHLIDANDPRNEKSNTASWVGFAFGTLIFLFIFSFGMTILRSVSREKTNRVVEVLLSSVKARQLLSGKVIGIGIAAILQFLVWILVIGVGLYVFRETLFPDLFSGKFIAQEIVKDNLDEAVFNQSPFVDLIYKDIQYGNMLLFFLLFFIGGYLFYGSFYAMLGASVGSESDGQQFVIPLTILILLSVASGYYLIYYPSINLEMWLGFIPFTSPMIMMIKLSNGFDSGDSWQLFLSLFILIISAYGMLVLAGRIYKNGLLRYNHRLKFVMLLKWMKKS